MKDNDGMSSPFLSSIVLNIDVMAMSSGLILVDHGNGSFIVAV